MTFSDFWQSIDTQRAAPIRAVLFDVDGTLASGPNPVPGANDLLQKFRENGTPFLLLTNDSHHSPAEKCAILSRAGIHAEPEEVVSCSHALKGYVWQHQLTGKRAFVMGEFGNPCYAEAAGLAVTRDDQALDGCDLVIVGEGHYDWHHDVTAVLNFFRAHPDRTLICANPDTYWPHALTGRIGVGAGAIANFITGLLREMQIEIRTVFLGKPWPGIYRAAMYHAAECFGLQDLQPGEVLMIGDSLRSDVAGARQLGMVSALVMTGITTPALLQAAGPELRPDYVFESVAR